ncbi:unnamed protein product [Lactuca saligna]|uniref:Uncharacterized protein n=1 Tax=Lactuca saligna TaxID=75948 RepID=A0AA35VSJ8_LACSI|nr:unnamed protein product [Lactuca saligna]
MSKVCYVFIPDGNVVKGPMLLILTSLSKKTTLPSQISSQMNTRIQVLKTSSSTSKASLFAMHFVISQSHSTLSKYVSSIILALSTLMLKPILEPLNMGIVGFLLMQHLFEFPYVFPNQKSTMKLLLRKNVGLFDPIGNNFSIQEEDDEGNNEDEQDYALDEEDDVDDEDDVDIGEACTQGMTNSPSRLNQHILFSSTSFSLTPCSEDIAQHTSSPPQVETIDPLIYIVKSPRPASPSPQTKMFITMSTPIQPIATFQEESSLNFEKKWFIYLECMPHTGLPLSVVYPDAYSEEEIPQGTYSDIDSDEDKLNPRKRNVTFSQGANDVEVGSSSIAGSSLAPPLFKKYKLTLDLEDLAED